MTIRWLALSLLLLSACGEEPQATVTPLPTSPHPRRAAVAEPPSPLISQPHLRRVEHASDAPAPAPRIGAGGGGSAQPLHDPTQREVDAFRERLQREVAENVNPEDDPCDQFRDVMGATLDDEPPSRAAMRQHCRDLPDAYRQCLSPQYFSEHGSECQEQLDRMAARGRRMTKRAQRQLDSMERGETPWPGQRRRDPEDG
jgi:hypothetical protein